jgi:hypothetical protein
LLTHLHPALCAINPPQIGPRTGPNRGPAPKIDMAIPRCSGSNKSDTTPPPMVKHADPPIPVRSLKTINAERFGASAHPIWNRTKKDVEMLRIILRPYISLKGDRNNGPNLDNLSGHWIVDCGLELRLHRSQINRMSL